MGRHSSGTNNYSLSTGAIAALTAAVVAVAAGVWFAAERPDRGSGGQQAATCVSGDLELPVSGADEQVARALIDAYAGSNPVVRDFCVKPVYVDSLSQAAVYVAPNTPVSHQQLAQANRTAAVSDPSPAAAQEVGVTGRDAPAAREQISPDSVVYPVDEEPSASALVASLLAGNDQDAVTALSEHRVAHVRDVENATDGARYAATTRDAAPEGLGFTGLGASVVHAAIPLNQGTGISEDQSRAGQDFARYSADHFDGNAASQPTISELVWAAATPSGGTELTRDTGSAAASSGAVSDTLFLLDTSDAMAPYLPQASDAIGAAARRVAAEGHRVGLWNYSSPLSPGVTRGYRENVALTPNAAEVAAAAGRFLTGGRPRTREAVSAAVDYARSAGSPVRVVVITTGTADGGADDDYANALKNATGSDVTVSVVHVGPDQEDPALRRVAASEAVAADGGKVGEAVTSAVGTQD